MITTPDTMIQDRKCGNVRMVWNHFFPLRILSSFKSKARMIGNGNWMISFRILMYNVRHTASIKVGSRNTYLKFSNPTHGLPKMPRLAL
ncbi:hypothetical protein D1872_329380 [compost metagenome]